MQTQNLINAVDAVAASNDLGSSIFMAIKERVAHYNSDADSLGIAGECGKLVRAIALEIGDILYRPRASDFIGAVFDGGNLGIEAREFSEEVDSAYLAAWEEIHHLISTGRGKAQADGQVAHDILATALGVAFDPIVVRMRAAKAA